MSTLAELENEVAQLKKDLATLREEFNHVTQIDREDDGSICSSRLCATLVVAKSFVLQDEKHKLHGMISSDEDGPCISLWGKDESGHVMLRVIENTGSIRVVGDNGDTAVELTDDERHGQIIVFSPGDIPRALLKGMESGGAISALDEKGKTLAILHSIRGRGEVVILKDKIHAKITSDDPSGGGGIWLFDKDGKRAIDLRTAPVGNGMFIHPPGEAENISLVATPLGACVRVGLVGPDGEKTAAVELQELPGQAARSFAATPLAQPPSISAPPAKAAASPCRTTPPAAAHQSPHRRRRRSDRSRPHRF